MLLQLEIFFLFLTFLLFIFFILCQLCNLFILKLLFFGFFIFKKQLASHFFQMYLIKVCVKQQKNNKEILH